MSTPTTPPSSDDGDDDDRTRIGTPLSVPPDTGTPATDDDDATQFDPSGASAPPPLAQPKTSALVPDGKKSTGVPVGVGTRINNNYEITHVLKSGGMGEVYRGIELGTGDPVAMKVILPELSEDEKAGQMFKREARTLRQLSDEAIVRYYNYVHDQEIDRYCLIMEFIDGVPLSDHIAEHGALPVPAVKTLMGRLAHGLGKAHLRDVIHRDLSPDNVMLPNGIVAEAVLIDFGIAKSNVLKESTMAGQFAGKFKYVSPEQLGHFDGNIGQGTDIYGLALLICMAATGTALPMGGSIVEAVQSRQSIPDLSSVPAELRPLLSHMLEPDPKNRPASMQDVQRMLEKPETIPLSYRDGIPLAQLTGNVQPAGLVTPPTGATGAGLAIPPQTLRPGAATDPTQRNVTAPPSSMTQAPVAPVKSGSSKVLLLLGLVFAGLMGTALFYAYDTGMLGNAPVVNPAEPDPPATQSAGLPEPLQSTREGFLAAFDTGACTYTTRVPSGQNAGMIAAMSARTNDFAGLPVAYEEAFGARPAILPQTVTQAQCATLEFARAIQGRTDKPVRMGLGRSTVVSGESLNARIADQGAGSLWAVLVSPQGRVFGLTDKLSQSVGGQRTMRFGLSLPQGRAPASQLILLVATDAPLASAAAAAEGAQASDLLPRVLEEISSRGGYISVDLAHLELQPAPAPEENSPDEPGSEAAAEEESED